MQDAWRAYLELALGVTEASRKRAEAAAREVAKDLLGRGEATAAQLQGAAEQLVATSRANREGLARLVRSEVDRTLRVVGPAVGLASTDEVAGLTARVRELERRLGGPPAAGAGAPAPAVAPATPTDPAATSAAKKLAEGPAQKPRENPAKQAVAKKATKQAGPKQTGDTRGAEAGNR